MRSRREALRASGEPRPSDGFAGLVGIPRTWQNRKTVTPTVLRSRELRRIGEIVEEHREELAVGQNYEEGVRKNLLEIYALTVCFASVMFLIVTVAMCLYEAVRITAPSATVAGWTYERSLSDEAFLSNWPQGRPVPEASTLARLRTDALRSALDSERHSGVNSLLQSLMYAIVAGVVFWLHWRLARRERLHSTA